VAAQLPKNVVGGLRSKLNSKMAVLHTQISLVVWFHIIGYKQKRRTIHTESSEHCREVFRIKTKRKIMQYCLDRSNSFLILTFGGMSLSDKYRANIMPE
jgi:hypothetical protein